MLDEKEIKKITDKIDEGKSDYRIWKETRHSVNTIGPIREIYEKTKKKKVQEDDERYNDPIDMTRGVISYLDTFLQKKDLSDRERKTRKFWGN